MSSQLSYIPATQHADRGWEEQHVWKCTLHFELKNFLGFLPDGQPRVPQGFGSTTRSNQWQTHIYQTFGELYQSGFVWHAQKGCEENKMNGT